MPQFNFPVPPKIDETLSLLNRSKDMRLTLILADGTVHGYFATEYGREKVTGNGTLQVVNGALDDSRVLFVADTAEQAAIFLCGCFSAPFMVKALKPSTTPSLSRSIRFRGMPPCPPSLGGSEMAPTPSPSPTLWATVACEERGAR